MLLFIFSNLCWQEKNCLQRRKKSRTKRRSDVFYYTARLSDDVPNGKFWIAWTNNPKACLRSTLLLSVRFWKSICSERKNPWFNSGHFQYIRTWSGRNNKYSNSKLQNRALLGEISFGKKLRKCFQHRRVDYFQPETWPTVEHSPRTVPRYNDINQQYEVEEELSIFRQLCVLSNRPRIPRHFNLKQWGKQFMKKT